MIRTLLFDLDGTLTESNPGVSNAVLYALEQMGVHEFDTANLRHFIGPPLVDSYRKYCGFSEEEAQKALAYYRVYYRSRGVKENSLFDGIRELLLSLKERGYYLATATAKPEEFTRVILENHGVLSLFDFIGAASLDKSRSTKNAVVRYTLEAIGNPDPSTVLLIGDRDQDCIGARENGIRCLGVLWGYGTREELAENGAFRIIERPSDLLPLLETMNE